MKNPDSPLAIELVRRLDGDRVKGTLLEWQMELLVDRCIDVLGTPFESNTDGEGIRHSYEVAIGTLGILGPQADRSIPLLIRLLQHEDMRVKSDAAHAILQIRGKLEGRKIFDSLDLSADDELREAIDTPYRFFE